MTQNIKKNPQIPINSAKTRSKSNEPNTKTHFRRHKSNKKKQKLKKWKHAKRR